MTPHVDEQLSAYLDEELDGISRQRVSKHLEGCDRCAARLAGLAAVDDLSRQTEVAAPAGYFDALPARIRNRLAEKAKPVWTFPRWTWAAAAAALIAVLAPLTIEQGSDLATEAAAPRSRETARAPAAPPTTIAARRDSQEALRQVRPLDENVAGAAGDEKTERLAEPASEGRMDALEPKLRAAPATLPAALPREPAPGPGDRPAQKAKAGERALAPRERPAATPAVAANAPVGFASSAVEAPAESDDAPAGTATGAEENEEVALAEPNGTSGKLAKPGRRENSDVRASAAAGLTTAEALRAPSDRSAVSELRRERERLKLDLRDQADADAIAEDERAVRIIEIGLRIYQATEDPADRSVAQEDIRRYLARPDAPSGARVRELERELTTRR